MIKTNTNLITRKLIKKPLSNLFTNKSSLEKLISFLSPKEKFRLLCNSKKLCQEYDSIIDDFFIPRKYQQKIKTYNYNYEDLFYQIIQEMKKENEGKKICIYEIENDMIKYLKYLVEKYNKIIKISLININTIDIWKFDFVTKILKTMEKNVYLKIKVNSNEIRGNEIFRFICRYSKAINTLEILDVIYHNDISDLILKTSFNWNTINKLIINMGDYTKKENTGKNKNEKFLIHLLNNINLKNLIDFDMRCNYINFKDIENFIYKNAKNIKILNIENYDLNIKKIEKNEILKEFENINELNLTINETKLEKLLYHFCPIFPKIKKFHLVINESLQNDFIDNFVVENEKNDKKNKNNENKSSEDSNIKPEFINFFENELNEFYSEDIFQDEKEDNIPKMNINNNNLKRISFTTHEEEIENIVKRRKRKKYLNTEIDEELYYDNKYNFELNLNNCESLIYEIKTSKINSNNCISYLIKFLEENKNHLKYLEIYINNEETAPININDFIELIQKISDCKNLNIFIFECELYNEYASLFNDNFNIGPSLTHLSLIHTTNLDIMKIIDDHINLNHIRFELISKWKILTEEYQKFPFNLGANRNWKNIDLTNYPINQNLLNILMNNKNISINFYFCSNLTDLDEKTFNELIKGNNSNENIW